MKKLNRFLRGLICILPLVLVFSYYPVISLGAGESMNFELSLPLIWLVVFDLVGLVALLRERKFVLLMRNSRWRCLGVLLLPIFVSLSLIWSDNLVRGVLTCGVMWLVFLAVFVMVEFKQWFVEDEFRKIFWKWFFGSALLMCVWCILQCVLDVVGVSREYSLMCLGCSSYSFGFPHPNGFAIEPQFMGNLLLAPTITAAWMYVKKQNNKQLEPEHSRGRVFHNKSGGAAPVFQYRTRAVAVVKNTSGSCSLSSNFLLFCFFYFTVTLFLVFSRGAIYAFFVALLFMSGFVVMRCKKNWKKVLRRVGMVWLSVVLGFLFTLNLQGIMTELGPTNDNYMDGVAKVLNQLSLGIIDIRNKNEKNMESLDIVENPVENFETESEEIDKKADAVFDGYVEESTEIRKLMTRNAIKVWSRDFKTMLFGVGIGGAGEAMYQAGLISTPKEIVQNEYASLLLEIGIVGVVLAVFLLIIVVCWVMKNNMNAGLVLTIIVAYGISLIFFSGFANALQIYLLPMLLAL